MSHNNGNGGKHNMRSKVTPGGGRNMTRDELNQAKKTVHRGVMFAIATTVVVCYLFLAALDEAPASTRVFIAHPSRAQVHAVARSFSARVGGNMACLHATKVQRSQKAWHDTRPGLMLCWNKARPQGVVAAVYMWRTAYRRGTWHSPFYVTDAGRRVYAPIGGRWHVT